MKKHGSRNLNDFNPKSIWFAPHHNHPRNNWHEFRIYFKNLVITSELWKFQSPFVKICQIIYYVWEFKDIFESKLLFTLHNNNNTYSVYVNPLEFGGYQHAILFSLSLTRVQHCVLTNLVLPLEWTELLSNLRLRTLSVVFLRLLFYDSSINLYTKIMT